MTTQGHLVRTTQWAGVSAGEAVVVDGPKERLQKWVFVAHVRNTKTNEEWIEVRGGRQGEAKTRSFRPEVIFAPSSKKGGRVVGPSLFDAPRLTLE